jgi:CRISPR-associated protein Cas1
MKKLLNTLYVTNPDAYVCLENENISVLLDHTPVLRVPMHILEAVVLFGHVSCSMPMLGACAKHGIRIVILDERGRFSARVEGPVSGNILLRESQYRLANDQAFALKVSKRFVAAKIANSRRVLQRKVRDHKELKSRLDSVILSLSQSVGNVLEAQSLDELRGLEGDAAHEYFSVFWEMISSADQAIKFNGRVRRPPTDPVNAALSFFYSMLSYDIASACETVGLDPQKGFYHQIRPGRQSLALDLVEEFRAPYVDRFVLSLFNRGQLASSDFQKDAEGAVSFNDSALKKALDAWQKRKQVKLIHPFLKEEVQIGLLPYIQAQLFARYLRGGLDDYAAFLWR